ncbi:PTS sugar transporter subunit IIA [Enterococcus faecalis]
MKKIIIATHSTMAQGLKDTLEFILGSQKSVSAITAYLSDEVTIEQEIDMLFDELDPEDELIVAVDLLGGSVANAFSQRVGRENFYLVSGVNLPMLLELCLSTEPDSSKLISQAINSGAKGMVFVNELLAENEEGELE